MPLHPPLSRNAALGGLFEEGQAPKAMKTGTTIAGVVFKASTKQKSLTEQNSDFGKNKHFSKCIDFLYLLGNHYFSLLKYK